jgi:hypothetical protein
MATMIQNRGLKARASMAGMSLSDYLLDENRQAANRPTLEEMRARLANRPPVALLDSSADVVRAQRDGM